MGESRSAGAASSSAGEAFYRSGAFWPARQRQANRIHEISYRACFKPQLPAYFIERFTDGGDVVHDPFMGRGTTPVEAALRGRIPYGSDINPLSRALVEPRINPPSIGAIAARLRGVPWRDFRDIEHEELLVFYHPDTLRRIEGLRRWLAKREEAGELDKADRWIRMAAISRLTGHSSGFFSVYTMPPNQAVSPARQKKINERRGQTPPFRDVPRLIAKKSKVLLSRERPEASESLFLTRPSSETPEIPDASVALTVTSPPFLNIVDYASDNWLRCWFLGVDPAAIPVTQRRRADEWHGFVRGAFVELARITRPGGRVAFEVGEARNGALRLDDYVLKAVDGLPFDALGVLVNQHEFTKTSNCWGISNNQKGVNSNRVVLLKRQ